MMPLGNRWAEMRWVAPRRRLSVQRIDLNHTIPEVVAAEVVAQAKAAFNHRGRGAIAILAWDSVVDGEERECPHQLCLPLPSTGSLT
jgi:hypothetical protein